LFCAPHLVLVLCVVWYWLVLYPVVMWQNCWILEMYVCACVYVCMHVCTCSSFCCLLMWCTAFHPGYRCFGGIDDNCLCILTIIPAAIIAGVTFTQFRVPSSVWSPKSVCWVTVEWAFRKLETSVSNILTLT
jgi:hypothetical protein